MILNLVANVAANRLRPLVSREARPIFDQIQILIDVTARRRRRSATKNDPNVIVVLRGASTANMSLSSPASVEGLSRILSIWVFGPPPPIQEPNMAFTTDSKRFDKTPALALPSCLDLLLHHCRPSLRTGRFTARILYSVTPRQVVAAIISAT